MKPQFLFWFVDEPQHAVPDMREYTAHLLRAYRAHPERYVLSRLGKHRYSVRTHDSAAVAILAADLYPPPI